MGRRSHTRALNVWQNGLLVGRWSFRPNGASELTYAESWLSSEAVRPLSLSLPINLDGAPLTGPRVAAYFDNLLPDSDVIRRRIQARYRTPSGDAFDLLAAIGRDCVGAVQLLPEAEQPAEVTRISARSLSSEKVEEYLNAVARPGVIHAGDDDEFRISLAGAQEKTAFLRHQGRWCVPRGSTPTTHIFKLPLGLVGNRAMDMSESLENEWLCARILREFSVSVAACELASFGDTRALIVTRFDRALHHTRKYWLRLPQEDLCQATGTPGATKYEADGGPGLREIASVLHSSETADADLATLLRAELLFWMLAATDGHAKNFSIHLLAGGRFRLTPLYDVLSAWPITGSRQNQLHKNKLRLALALRATSKHYRLSEIRRYHFNATARLCGFGVDMNELIDEVVAATPGVIERVGAALPSGFPEKLFTVITRGLAQSARSLASQAK
jgi:serine/threonine-protein kinase HipA